MLRTDLEALLEAGFYALGAPLTRRVYYEEFLAGATIDDEHGRDSMGAYRKRLAEILGSDVDLNDELLVWFESELSEIQLRVEQGDVPFFLRKFGVFNGCWLEYEVNSTEELSHYEDQADRLIKEGKISEQFIYFYSVEHGLLSEIGINTNLRKPNTITSIIVHEESFKNHYDSVGQDSAKKSEIINGIDGKPFDPEITYKAVMDFIR